MCARFKRPWIIVTMTRLWQGVVILAVVAGTFSQTDIDVQCGRDSVQVTWNIIPERVSNVSRHFLGTCRPSTFSVLPTGVGVLQFNYPLYDCKFRTLITERQLVYANDLTYRPFGKPTAAEFTHPIECVYRRPDTWMPPFLTPGSGTLEGHGGLVFHMELLNEQLTGMAKNNVFALGSFIPIWAAVEQGSHQPLLLLLEECAATDTPDLRPGSRVHRIVTEKGCLLDSKEGNSKFLPRYHSSAILLHLQAFRFPLGEVYIHCKLVAWDPEVLDEHKKACHYIKETGGWELLDDPSQSDICSCCESNCGTRRKRGLRSASGSCSKCCARTTDHRGVFKATTNREIPPRLTRYVSPQVTGVCDLGVRCPGPLVSFCHTVLTLMWNQQLYCRLL